MPSVKATVSQVMQVAQEALREARRAAGVARDTIVNPKPLTRVAEGATRAGQVTALVFLPFIVVVSFTIILVVNNLMAEVLGSGSIGGEQLTITSFLVTFLTLVLLVIVAWGWFQWVRTAGFGAFSQ